MSIFFVNTQDAQISNAFLATLGVAPGSTYLAQVKTFGLVPSVQAMINATGSSTAAALSTKVATNLGLTGAALTGGTAYLSSVTFAGSSSAWAANLMETLNLFSNLQSDATYGSAATAYLARVNSAVSYSSVATNNSTDLSTLAAAVGSAGSTGAGSTFTLTAGVDGPGAVTPAANTQGGSGADTFNGTIVTADAGTLNSADNLVGGLGVDTLIARVTGLTAATTITPEMSSIETVRIANVVADATGGVIAALNLASSTGTTTLGIANTVTNSQTAIVNASTTAKILLDNADGVVQRFNLGSNAGRSGTADAFDITIQGGSGSATATANLGLITNAAGFATEDVSFETMNITVGAGGINNIDMTLGASSIRNIVVSGAGTPGTGNTAGQVLILQGAGNFTALRSVDASAMTTGGLNLSAALDQNITFIGSSFNDRLNITAGVGTLSSADSINFGTGTSDTLAFGTTVDFRAATLGVVTTGLLNAITTADVLEAAAAGAVQIRLADFTTIDTFVLSGATGAGGAAISTNNAIITGVQTADTLRVAADIRTIGAAGSASADATTATIAPGASGANGVDNIQLAGQAVGQTASIVLTGGIDLQSNAGAGGAGGAMTAAGASTAANGGSGGAGANAIDVATGGNISTLNILSIGTVANTLLGGNGGAGGAGGAAANAAARAGSGGAGGNGGVAIDNGAGLTQVNITGTAGLTIAGGIGGAGGGTAAGGGTVGPSGVNGTDAVGFANAVNVNASTFTGVLTITGSTAADQITGGSGNDVINTGGGLDILRGGLGNDDFRISGSAATTATEYVVIADWNNGDQISILSEVAAAAALNGTAVYNSVAVDVSTATTIAAALNLAAAATTAGTNSVVRWFNFGGNTFVVVDNANDATLQTGDGVIQLVGVHTLGVGSVDFA